MEVCQTLSLLMLALAGFQKSCRHFPVQGRECFLKVYLRLLMVIPRKDLSSHELGCFCSTVFQSSAVKHSVHVWDNICRCKSCQCFYMKISPLIVFHKSQNSDNYCPWNIAECFEKNMNVYSFMTYSGIYLFPLTVFLTFLAVRLCMLTASLFLWRPGQLCHLGWELSFSLCCLLKFCTGVKSEDWSADLSRCMNRSLCRINWRDKELKSIWNLIGTFLVFSA